MKVSQNTKGLPLCQPLIVGSVEPPELSAATRSGTAWASAPNMQSMVR
jgi:hypothetical protein